MLISRALFSQGEKETEHRGHAQDKVWNRVRVMHGIIRGIGWGLDLKSGHEGRKSDVT